MAQSSNGESSLLAPGGATRTPSEALAEVERALLAELDSTRFLHLLVESASRLFGALTGVWLIAEDGVLVERITSVPGTFPAGRVTFGEGMTGRCAQARRGLLVLDYPRWPHALPRYVAADLRHAMAHPLVMGDRILGVITMSRTGAGATPFTDDDFASLEHLAGLAALALRNAKLYEEAERRRREAEGLAQVARTLTGILDVGQVASRITESVLTLFPGCLGAGVAACQAEGPAEVLAVGGPLSAVVQAGRPFVPGPLLDRVRREQRIACVADLQAEPEPADPPNAALDREPEG
ncbi:MAG: GAF domain-containing protein [Candidatus Rokuibacteriota bacterium]